MFVEPKVFMIGETCANMSGIREYLEYTQQVGFLDSWNSCELTEAEKLTSLFAKLCYKSLVVGKNENISKVRAIHDNLIGTLESAHGSVFEHCVLNFVATDVSRILTHELVRHRAGWAYSQTSGRYVKSELKFVFDPILKDVESEVRELLEHVEKKYKQLSEKMMPGRDKKKITSALRRILPNGQSNEIGISINLRAIRHFVMIRTSRHAEWEIRKVAGQIYELVKKKYPLIFYGAKEQMIDGMLEISGMKLQPYEEK